MVASLLLKEAVFGPSYSLAVLLGLHHAGKDERPLRVVISFAANEHNSRPSINSEEFPDGSAGIPELHTGHLEAATGERNSGTTAKLPPPISHTGSAAPGMPSVHGCTSAVTWWITLTPRVERASQFTADINHAVLDSNLLDLGVHPNGRNPDVGRLGDRHTMSPEAHGDSEQYCRGEATDHAATRSAPVGGRLVGGFGQGLVVNLTVHFFLPLIL